jgi:hypothetical protein
MSIISLSIRIVLLKRVARSLPFFASAYPPKHVAPAVKDEAAPLNRTVYIRNRIFGIISCMFAGLCFNLVGEAIVKYRGLRGVEGGHRLHLGRDARHFPVAFSEYAEATSHGRRAAPESDCDRKARTPRRLKFK